MRRFRFTRELERGLRQSITLWRIRKSTRTGYGRFASCRASDAASKNFMARNGIWVHLAAIKRQRCKELSATTPPSAQSAPFIPRGSTLGVTKLLQFAPPLYHRRRCASVHSVLDRPANIHFQGQRFGRARRKTCRGIRAAASRLAGKLCPGRSMRSGEKLSATGRRNKFGTDRGQGPGSARAAGRREHQGRW